MRGLIFIDGANLFHSIKNYNKENNTKYRIKFHQII